MAINELAFAGSWFYGAADGTERAALYSSWGLLDSAPAPSEPVTDYVTGWDGQKIDGWSTNGPWDDEV